MRCIQTAKKPAVFLICTPVSDLTFATIVFGIASKGMGKLVCLEFKLFLRNSGMVPMEFPFFFADTSAAVFVSLRVMSSVSFFVFSWPFHPSYNDS